MGALLRLSIGQRDSRLLELRELTFGGVLECLILCPSCGDQLELSFSTAELLAYAERGAGDPPELEFTGHTLDVEGWQLRFRLPDSLDLLDTVMADPREARDRLLRRCVTEIAPPGEVNEPGLPEGGLPQGVEVALLAEMQRRDAASSFSFALACPACSHHWAAAFDILAFFWMEIEAWGYRTLRDVHLLAQAYGWGESDILALSSWRRQKYLEMCGG
jgi:hypothetical protein